LTHEWVGVLTGLYTCLTHCIVMIIHGSGKAVKEAVASTTAQRSRNRLHAAQPEVAWTRFWHGNGGMHCDHRGSLSAARRTWECLKV